VQKPEPAGPVVGPTLVAAEAPIVHFVNRMLWQAIDERASDIHIEPTEADLRVRYRIDGVLHEMDRSPKAIHAGVISRLKIMADMNIAERRVPQDGRFSVNHQGRTIDLRIATLPTVWGETVVVRILDNTAAALDLNELGFGPENFRRYKQAYSKPHGMILVTGPTASGKSTTLYATLNSLNSAAVKIITVEDPVEYRMSGVNQVQTNAQSGLTFARALRSILRADPDIILIGEIRDHETAQIAVEAALTGHLVLSTLHTNDAPSAIGRLVEMGIEPFLVGSALDTIVAQRLCRMLCTTCRQPYDPGAGQLAELRFPIDDTGIPTLYRPVGCSQCARSGYRGRMALHEVMAVTEEIERLGVARATAEEIGKVAVENGMTRLRDDGWLKVRRGLTSIEEVLRVIA
jgi:type IV pilus assembly protein PilB